MPLLAPIDTASARLPRRVAQPKQLALKAAQHAQRGGVVPAGDDLPVKSGAIGEIAAALAVSLKTVRNHVSNVFTKLRVATRAQAIVKAREGGMGSDAHPS